MLKGWKSILGFMFLPILFSACVTHTLNSDGTVQNNTVDTKKLSDTYIDLAVEYQKRGAPQVALDRANLAVKTDSDNPKAYMIRAMIYQSLNQNEAAEKDFKKALWLNDNYSEAYVNYAVFLCDIKRYSEAEENFAKALANPLYYTPEIGYYNRGKCEFQQSKYESANRDYLKSLTYRTPPQEVYIAMAQLQFNQKNYALANYYINKYSGSQTSATLWLHIQILQAMINESSSSNKAHEYISYRNTLTNLLVNNYGDSPEAQQYLLSSGKSAPLTSKSMIVAAESANTSMQAIHKTSSSQVKPNQIQVKNILVDRAGRPYVIVKPRDTLFSISRETGVATAKILELNKVTNGIVKTGNRLYLD